MQTLIVMYAVTWVAIVAYVVRMAFANRALARRLCRRLPPYSLKPTQFAHSKSVVTTTCESSAVGPRTWSLP